MGINQRIQMLPIFPFWDFFYKIKKNWDYYLHSKKIRDFIFIKLKKMGLFL